MKLIYSLKLFSAQLLGSWLITPIAFLIAQLASQGESSYNFVILVLVGTLSPIIASANETVAIVLAQERGLADVKILISVPLMLSVCAGISIAWIALSDVSLGGSSFLDLLIIYFSAIFGFLFSFVSSYLFLINAKTGLLSKRFAFFVGFLPNCAFQLLIIFSTFSYSFAFKQTFVASIALSFPSFCQMIYLYSRNRFAFHSMLLKVFRELSALSIKFKAPRLYLRSFCDYFVLFVATTVGSISVTMIKVTMASSVVGYSNLIIVGFGVIASVLSMIARSLYVSSDKKSYSSAARSKNNSIMLVSSLSVMVLSGVAYYYCHFLPYPSRSPASYFLVLILLLITYFIVLIAASARHVLTDPFRATLI